MKTPRSPLHLYLLLFLMVHLFRLPSELSALLRARLTSLRTVQRRFVYLRPEILCHSCRQQTYTSQPETWRDIIRSYSQSSNGRGDGDKDPTPEDTKEDDPKQLSRAEEIDRFRRPDGYYPTGGIQPEEQKDHPRHDDYMRYRNPPSFEAVDKSSSLGGNQILLLLNFGMFIVLPVVNKYIS